MVFVGENILKAEEAGVTQGSEEFRIGQHESHPPGTPRTSSKPQTVAILSKLSSLYWKVKENFGEKFWKVLRNL